VQRDFRNGKHGKCFFKDSEDWGGSKEMEERIKTNIFTPNIKRFDRYLNDRDWLNVYLNLQEPFWYIQTEVSAKALNQDLDKIGIEISLIKDIDYMLVTKEELKQKSF